jgi:hypothetical protein
MISPNSFTPEWIQEHRGREGFEKINPPLLEKMIRALALVEGLSTAGLDFIFKGGTSLILLLPATASGRFSIDIDIVTQADRIEIEKILAELCSNQHFKYFALDVKRSYQPGIPKAHYKLYYQSGLSGKEEYVLLDILLDSHGYPEIVEIPVNCDWLMVSGDIVKVKLPARESITGDKLTAFAPNTTGILYGKRKELEIIKQLFDIGRLFNEIKNMETVATSFNSHVVKEIAYRGNTCSRENVLNDIIQTALMIAKREKNKEEPYLSQYKEIQRGLTQFIPYQMKPSFRLDQAITATAKAALLAAKIKSESYTLPAIYAPGFNKNQFLIEHSSYNFLNKLQAEPLFYWNQTIKLIAKTG